MRIRLGGKVREREETGERRGVGKSEENTKVESGTESTVKVVLPKV